ncbi:hypothetical protein RHIZO_03879 [Rhizobiaceae bacterium]|nr:hypothetical protein RHIZO_03879 [Rhizobiaceae bacterium]
MTIPHDTSLRGQTGPVFVTGRIEFLGGRP